MTMKRLINPPIQNLLWVGGIACLGLAAWSVWQLRQAEEQQFATTRVSVDIPNARELSVPGVRQYRKLIEAPLFWEARAIPKKAPPPKQVAVVQQPEVVEVALNLPVGRLVGIVDLGEKKYALVRNAEQSQSLRKGDAWEGWTIEDINAERVVISAGKQRHEVALIGDFEAPTANKQMLASKQRQQQHRRNRQQQQLQLRQQQKQQAQHYDRAANQAQPQAVNPAAQAVPQLSSQSQNVAGNNPQQAAPAPVLSIKEALEARQRLMASRWGDGKKK